MLSFTVFGEDSQYFAVECDFSRRVFFFFLIDANFLNVGSFKEIMIS